MTRPTTDRPHLLIAGHPRSGTHALARAVNDHLDVTATRTNHFAHDEPHPGPAIVIVRHPVDVMRSYQAYRPFPVPPARNFITPYRVDRWANHVRQWADDPRTFEVVTYHDLVTDGRAVLRSITNALGIDSPAHYQHPPHVGQTGPRGRTPPDDLPEQVASMITNRATDLIAEHRLQTTGVFPAPSQHADPNEQ